MDAQEALGPHEHHDDEGDGIGDHAVLGDAAEGLGEDGEEAYGPIAYLADTGHEPTALIESHQRDVMASDGIAAALETLDPRARRIVQERWLKVNDDGSGGMTLHELAEQYQVSAERIRQIEVAAMKKMRQALLAYA